MKLSEDQTRVIYNPSARGRRAARLIAQLLQMVPEACLRSTSGPGSARSLAAEAVRNGISIIVVAGGDGTINEAVNGLGDVPGGFSRTSLAIFPLGTANVFAHELDVSFNLKQAFETFSTSAGDLVDLPSAQFSSGGLTSQRYFVQLAGAGLDASAARLVRWNLKRRFGKLAYVMAGIEALRTRQEKIQVDHDGGRAFAELVLIGNGRFYGGRFKLFPRADLRDGKLDVCLFERLNAVALTRYVLAAFTNRISTCKGLCHFSTETLKLASSAGNSVSVQLDGEHVGRLPAVFSVRRRALRIIGSAL